MADIFIKCKKAITDDFNRCPDIEDGESFTHIECNKTKWDKEINEFN
jgi:hypothetical protein